MAVNYVTICDTFHWCKTEIRISSDDPIDANTPVTLSIRMAGATMQTYATREEIRQLAEVLMQHANENEVMEVAA